MQDRETALKALVEYIEWHGPLHEDDCPGDDTCDCDFRPMNAGVNLACRLLASPLSAPPQEPTGASPQAEMTQCDYCHTWRSRPCGEGCCWQPAPVSPVEPTVNRALREANDCLAAIRARLWEVLNGRDLGGDRSLLGMVNMLIGQRDEARENRRGEFELRMVAEAVEPTPEPETCEWRYSADAEWWQSGCDSQDLSGDERLVGPDEKAKFCPYCGKPLRLVPSEETK